ncbi:GNAT family N-acetyltransferase [Zunongwangia sp. F260]|jgi:predicted GNAT family acetyltransferase|uniref:GNAT family N-acetyltransferase n=2 Tax=Autumnicola TaxID=3160927 RepID=A0ABU3CTP7_9FLAO|nr:MULTISPECIES: GNAT family N-acetyltransferase [unclassified Zunongwangia]MDT0647496.1 GNAT family N-acetyltransferase [Zunongwangia sp. F260]MDT0649733.1 GNAT family N-acetyltransferase [Zunongwangia sp. F297]
MDIKHKESDTRGMFYIEGEKGIIAELTYKRQDNNIILIDHTKVDRKFEGQGLATELLKRSVEHARENNLKIDPLCPFAEVQFERHKSYEDVRATR